MYFAEWLEIYRWEDILLSLAVGAVIGLLIGLAFRRPRTWVAAGILALLALLSPFIGVHTVLFWSDYGMGEDLDLYYGSGINFPPFLLAITLTCAVCFLARKIYRHYLPSMRQELAEVSVS